MRKSAIFLLVVMVLSACGGKSEETKKKKTDYKLSKIDQLVGIARIEPESKICPIGSEIPGRVVSILVSEGEAVKKGQLIMLLDESSELAQVQQSTSKINTRQQRVKSLEAKISAIGIKLNAADVERKRDRALANAKAGTEKAATDSETTYKNLEADLIIAKADLAEAIAGISEINAESNYLSQLKNKKRVYAPEDGMMLNWDVKLGQAIAAGTKLGDFAPAGNLMAITEIDELYALKVKNGQKVSINLQGTNEKLSNGTVIYCAPYLSKKSIFSDRADNLEDRRVREVHVRVDNPKAVLIGSRVECIISL
jgi:multidrug efflux pump subunit AcrA (membrane-fusion protein)